MRIVVIGGGFLSTNLVSHWCRVYPHSKVCVYSFSETFGSFDQIQGRPTSALLAEISAVLKKIFANEPADVVVCAAADTTHFGNYSRHLLLNYRLPKLILRLAPEHSLKVFFTSDIAYHVDVYRRLPKPVFRFLLSDYAHSKYLLEWLLRRRLRHGFPDFYCFRLSALVKGGACLGNAQKNLCRMRLAGFVFMLPSSSAMQASDVDACCVDIIERVGDPSGRRGFFNAPSFYARIENLLYECAGESRVVALPVPRFCFFLLFLFMNVVTKLTGGRLFGLGLINYRHSFRKLGL